MLLFNYVPEIYKKLVSVLAIFTLMTETSKKDKVILKRVLYIHYLFCFYKDKKDEIKTLINSNNKINTMTLAYTSKLGQKVCSTNVEA